MARTPVIFAGNSFRGDGAADRMILAADL